MEQENRFNDKKLSEQLIQESIAKLRWKEQEREEQRHKKALASREAELEIQLPAYLKVTDEGFIQYQETSCLPTPNGENIGLRKIGTNQGGSRGQVTERKYSVDEMIILAAEIATNELVGHPELLYQKDWAHVKSCLPIECKEDYVKSMVRSAIVMYLEKIRKPGFRAVIFSDEGYGKINVDEPRGQTLDLVVYDDGPLLSPHSVSEVTPKPYIDSELDIGFYYCPYNPFEKQDHIDNYDRAMKFVV